MVHAAVNMHEANADQADLNEDIGQLLFRSAGERGGAAGERVQCTGARQHGMGICSGVTVGCEAVCSDEARSGVAGERAQCTGTRQHGMGICNGAPVG